VSTAWGFAFSGAHIAIQHRLTVWWGIDLGVAQGKAPP